MKCHNTVIKFDVNNDKQYYQNKVPSLMNSDKEEEDD